jgi:hypothetical protein
VKARRFMEYAVPRLRKALEKLTRKNPPPDLPKTFPQLPTRETAFVYAAGSDERRSRFPSRANPRSGLRRS